MLFSFLRMVGNQLADTLKRKLHDLQISNLTPEEAYKLYMITTLDYYVGINTMPTDNYKEIILSAIATVHPRDEERLTFFMDKLRDP